MKNLPGYLAALFCAGVLPTLAIAAEKQAAEVKKGLRVLATADDDRTPKEPATFLGVETSPVSRTLTEQLGLAPDMGLVVNAVVPDSPASTVLKPHDILLKLDDQKLIEVRQLSVLIRGHQEGDEVTLTYMRGGKETTGKVKLVKRDVPRLSLFTLPLPGGEGDRTFEYSRIPAPPREEMERILPLIDMGREMKARVMHASPAGEAGGVTIINTPNSNFVFNDAAGSLEMKVTDGKKQVTAKDAKGVVIFSGPYNTDAERSAAPAEVRARLERIESMDRFRFKIDSDFRPGSADVIVPVGRRIQFDLPATQPMRRIPAPITPFL